MTLLTVLIFMVSAFEIWSMIKKKQYREMAVVIAIAILSLSLGFFYLSDPYRESLAQLILSLLRKEF